MRIDIFQNEIKSFFSALKKLQEENKLNDPALISLANKRAEEYKNEFKELEKRFQQSIGRSANT
jgi:hypothetical protein